MSVFNWVKKIICDICGKEEDFFKPPYLEESEYKTQLGYESVQTKNGIADICKDCIQNGVKINVQTTKIPTGCG